MNTSVPFLLLILFAVSGLGMLLGGIYILAGLGWALVAGSLPAFGAAMTLYKGIARVQ